VDLAGFGRRSGRHHFAHLDVFVAWLQHGADAFQRELHRDVEVLRLARTEVISVRIGAVGVGGHEGLESIVAVELLDPLDVAGVTLVQHLADFVIALAGKLEPQPVVLGALAPQIVQFGLILRPRGVLAVEGVAFVAGEVEARLEQCACVVHAFHGALHVQVEHRERAVQLAIPDRIVQLGRQRREAVHVGLGEEHLLAVEQIHVRLVDASGHRIVQWLGVVVETGEEARRELRGVGFAVGGLDRQRRGRMRRVVADGRSSRRLRVRRAQEQGQQQRRRETQGHGWALRQAR